MTLFRERRDKTFEYYKSSKKRKQALTLIAQDSAPIHVAYALPWCTVAVTVFASRIRHALIAKLALPSFSASNREKTRRFFVSMHVITFVFITLHVNKCATDVFFERKRRFRRPSVNETRVFRGSVESGKKSDRPNAGSRWSARTKRIYTADPVDQDFERWSEFSDNLFLVPGTHG